MGRNWQLFIDYSLLLARLLFAALIFLFEIEHKSDNNNNSSSNNNKNKKL